MLSFATFQRGYDVVISVQSDNYRAAKHGRDPCTGQETREFKNGWCGEAWSKRKLGQHVQREDHYSKTYFQEGEIEDEKIGEVFPDSSDARHHDTDENV